MKQKFREWVRRYLPAEILSILVTLLSVSLTFEVTGNQITTALVGTWAGNIAYFGFIVFGDIFKSLKMCRLTGLPYTRANLFRNIRSLALEFGVAEIFDSFFIRPALMYYFPIWVGSLPLGVMLAKLSADVTFYIPAIVSYELNKKYLINRIK